MASGCSELDSTAAEYATNSSSDVPGAAATSGGTARQGPGLVEDDHIQSAGAFERKPVLNKGPILSPEYR